MADNDPDAPVDEQQVPQDDALLAADAPTSDAPAESSNLPEGEATDIPPGDEDKARDYSAMRNAFMEASSVVPKSAAPGALTAELVGQNLSLLARTGNGLNHAYTRLEIHNKDITNLDILENYPHLRYLDMSDNRISDIDALSSLEYLLSLDLHSNSLRVIPAAIDKRKYLQQANFAKNSIERIDVVSWPMLGWLNISENQLTVLNLEEFSELVHLEARLNKLTHTSGIRAPKVQRMYLAQNQIRHLVDLDDKPNLILLHLRENFIETLDGINENLKSLSYLNLRGNRISSFDQIDHLAVLPNLKSLSLVENPITELPNYRLEIIMRLKKLERLDKDPVTEDEREEAEQYHLQLEKARKDAEDVHEDAAEEDH
ncbi:uncharacterized protein BJ171DRAFT_600383 [Polychytrium aggregatum]|uniref:uncharacterized protein n=1 Tax=Polychytrium aggregatum TaxID=110093 RepID=UPI0022FEC8AC|nr:uncharacterized protein BJ171DRAFT_600383 [Polychytrium aggregatum]KAI9202928.1 hypothetical protein BJ171DRAFT_600383 [Polychytrium aggregatum]